MRPLHAALAATLLAAGSRPGCDTAFRPATPNPDKVAQTDYPNVTLSPDLQGWVVVNPSTVTRDGVMKVSTPVRLVSSESGQFSRVQYRYIFLDKDGAPLRAQPDWKYIKLEPRQQVFLTSNALDAAAKDWRLEIRTNR